MHRKEVLADLSGVVRRPTAGAFAPPRVVGVLRIESFLSHSSQRAPVQTDATRTASSANRAAAGERAPARCTRASSRTAGGSGRATTAPSCSATRAIDSGTSAAPAPARTRGRMASRCADTTANFGSRPTEPSRSSRRRRVEVPCGRCHEQRVLEVDQCRRCGDAARCARGKNENEHLRPKSGGLERAGDAQVSVSPSSDVPVSTSSNSSRESSGAARSTRMPG